MKVNNIETKEKCAEELARMHNNLISRRFLTMLENRENSTGNPLNDDEIIELKDRFNTEIYRELIAKGAGK